MDDQDQGAIPEEIDPSDDTGQRDQTIDPIARAMDLVDRALVYGYQKFGLHGGQMGQGQGQSQPDTPIPDDDNDQENDGDEDDVQSFAKGGVVEGEDEEPSGFRDAAPEGGAIPEEDQSFGAKRERLKQSMKGAADTVLDQFQPTETDRWIGQGLQSVGDTVMGGLRAASRFTNSMNSAVANGASSLLDLVRGTDAMPKDQAQAAEAATAQQVQQASQAGQDLSPSDQRMMALVNAAQDDPEKAWGFLQHYRQKFDAARSFAARALDKQNVTSATNALNTAFNHVLNGSDVMFSPIPRGDGGVSGVSALVATKGASPVKLTLTLPQFRQLLSDPSGSYDSLMNLGASNAIQQVRGQTPTGISGYGGAITHTAPQQAGQGAPKEYTLDDELKQLDRLPYREQAAAKAKAIQEHLKRQSTERTWGNRAQLGLQGRQLTADAHLQGISAQAQAAAERQLARIHSQQEIAQMKESGLWDRMVAQTAQAYDRSVVNATGNPDKVPEARKNYQAPVRPQGQQATSSSGTVGGGTLTAPQIGEVRKGYRFKGGDPRDKSNWEKAQ